MNVRMVNDTSLLKPSTADVGQKLSVGEEVKSFTAFANETKVVLVTVETNIVHATFDGTNPSATVGNALPVGTILWLSKEAAAAAKFYQVTAGVVVHGSPFTY